MKAWVCAESGDFGCIPSCVFVEDCTSERPKLAAEGCDVRKAREDDGSAGGRDGESAEIG